VTRDEIARALRAIVRRALEPGATVNELGHAVMDLIQSLEDGPS
jgi:hypothetical protein